MDTIYGQEPFECKMDWGTRGVLEASNRKDIIVIIDVLSFSTAVTQAVQAGIIIYPFSKAEDPKPLAHAVGAEIMVGRKEAKETGLPSQSPKSFNEAFKGKKYILSTINGGTCVQASKNAQVLLVGSFRNASVVAQAINKLRQETKSNVTVIACGERWNGEVSELRPSIEDYLCAGMILSKLEGTKSPESEVCIAAYEQTKGNIQQLIWDSVTGRELRLKLGFPEDVEFSSEIDVAETVPVLVPDEQGYMYFKSI